MFKKKKRLEAREQVLNVLLVMLKQGSGVRTSGAMALAIFMFLIELRLPIYG